MSMIGSNDKLKQAAAGAGGGEALNVEDVFSTYLYNGTATNVSHQIQNGIDLAGEGGLVWIKKRDSLIQATNHYLSDTERGNYQIASNSTNAQAAGDIASYNSDGWTFNASTGLGTDYNGATYASWTFRKAPKFFDVVTWTGDAVAGREISHNLGSVPGCIMIKQTTGTNNWIVYHRGANGGTNPEQYNLYLNLTNAQEDFILFDDTAPTATNFTVGGYASVNGSGHNYVAYLFAHNDGDGGFGADSDLDIIKCGSYTGNGSSQDIDLGFEPQWVLFKNASYNDIYDISHWSIYDNMRGVIVGGDDTHLRANTSDADQTQNDELKFTATGFSPQMGLRTLNASGDKYIYIAIRRGTKVPESATEVFDVTTHNATVAPGFKSDFPVDFALIRNVTAASSVEAASRLTQGKSLSTASTAAETSDASFLFDYQDGWRDTTGTFTNLYSWLWKRAPGFFDAVAYTGNGTNPHAVSHNLGVAPELIWIKSRDNARSWTSSIPTGSGISTTQRLMLNSGTGAVSQAYFPSQPTATEFSIISDPDINANGEDYIAYLFASLPGISKVGSVTHTQGTDTNVYCGFTSGARFILLKRTDGASSWYVWDTERGIVAGNDQVIYLQSTLAEQTGDSVDPLSSGFTMVGGSFDTGSYIFYAIA